MSESRGKRNRICKRWVNAPLARSLPLPIDEFGQIGGTNWPRRFLSSQPECLAREKLRRRAALRFQRTQPKIFRSDFFQGDVASPNSASKPK
jgi:hypothetical protein